MARRCPRSKALGLARLERHRLAVMREGWLTAVRDPRSAVHGVLWDLALSDVAALDRYEGVPQGLYAKLMQPVIAGRAPKQAIVCFGANSGPGAARPAYMAEVLAAARSWPLPAKGSRRWRQSRGGRALLSIRRTALRAQVYARQSFQWVSTSFAPLLLGVAWSLIFLAANRGSRDRGRFFVDRPRPRPGAPAAFGNRPSERNQQIPYSEAPAIN